MLELELKGSYYEIGLTLGEKCRGLASSYYSTERSRQTIDFANKCQESVEEHCPELLEELQGIADGGDFDYRKLISSELAMGLASGCTVFVVAGNHTINGSPLFARSVDWFREALKLVAIFGTSPTGKIASLGLSETFVGRLGGVNETGLAIGSTNTLWGNFQPGILDGIATRWILDSYSTVDEAVSFLQRIPHVMGNHYLVADKENHSARVETHPAKTVVTREQKDLLAVANHYFSPDFDEITPEKPKHSMDRIAYLNSWFNTRTNPVDPEEIKTVQRTHEVEMCPHVREVYDGKLMNLTTCWAWIASLGEDVMYVCEGSPCQNEYEEYSLS